MAFGGTSVWVHISLEPKQEHVREDVGKAELKGKKEKNNADMRKGSTCDSDWVNPNVSVNISRRFNVQTKNHQYVCTHPSPQQDAPEFNYQHEVFCTRPARPAPSHGAKTHTFT